MNSYKARLKRLEANHKPLMPLPHLFVTKPDGQRVDLFHDTGVLDWLGWARMPEQDDSARSA